MSNFHRSLIFIGTIELVLIVFGVMFGQYLGALILPVLYVGVLFLMSMQLGMNFYLSTIDELILDKVMLTFDDGPHPDRTPIVLDVLKKHQVKAMFFLIGKHIEMYPDIAQRIVNEGHMIGSHSQNHQWSFGMTFGKRLEREIMDCQQKVSELSGKENLWFRPPFGVTNPNIAKVVRRNDLKVVGWNVRSFDTTKKNPNKLLQKLLKKTHHGSIILLHDRMQITGDILGELIDGLREKGYKFGALTIEE